MNLLAALVLMLMAVSAVQSVVAADAPTPPPSSDAALFVPTAFASLIALAFGFLL